MNKDFYQTIQSLDTGDFNDYKFLVNELRGIFTKYDALNNKALIRDRDIEGFTVRAKDVKSAKKAFNEKLSEFVERFIWKGNEELIKQELKKNPEILDEMRSEIFTYFMPLDFYDEIYSSGPNSVNVISVRKRHFDDNLKTNYYKTSIQPKKSNEGCFIATYSYGDYNDPTVLILRNFRDSILVNYKAGKFFIRKYYEYSPGLVRIFQKVRFPRIVLKGIITLLVKFFIKPKK